MRCAGLLPTKTLLGPVCVHSLHDRHTPLCTWHMRRHWVKGYNIILCLLLLLRRFLTLKQRVFFHKAMSRSGAMALTMLSKEILSSTMLAQAFDRMSLTINPVKYPRPVDTLIEREEPKPTQIALCPQSAATENPVNGCGAVSLTLVRVRVKGS